MKKIILILFVLIVVGVLSFNFLMKNALIMTVSKMTGAEVKLESFEINLLKQELTIKNFILNNPSGFPNTALIDIPEVTVAIKAQALTKGLVHLPLVVLNMREMNIVKNQEGKLNVDSLQFVKNPDKENKKKKESEQKNIPFKISLLKLTIGKVIYTEYVQGQTDPKIKIYNIDLNKKEFRDITSPQQLATLILVQSMTPTMIHSTAVSALSTIENLESLTVDKATGFLKRIKEKLK